MSSYMNLFSVFCFLLGLLVVPLGLRAENPSLDPLRKIRDRMYFKMEKRGLITVQAEIGGEK